MSSMPTPLRRIMSPIRGGNAALFSGGFCVIRFGSGANSGCVWPSNAFGDDGRSQSNVSCNDNFRLACIPDGNVQLDVITSSERCKGNEEKCIKIGYGIVKANKNFTNWSEIYYCDGNEKRNEKWNKSKSGKVFFRKTFKKNDKYMSRSMFNGKKWNRFK